MAEAQVSIVILSWNSKAYLGECLDSVKAQTCAKPEILVVDNGSADGSPEFVRDRYPDVRLIVQHENLGFARGNNIGIAASSGEFVMTLNSDVVLHPDYIERLIRAFETKGGRLGMASGKLFRPGQTCLDSTGLVLTRARRFFDRGSGEVDYGQYDRDTDIFGPCAAAALFRRAMLEDVRYGDEYFDADFFAYVEDVDLAWRARRLGWKACFVPDATAIHVRGGSKTPSYLKQAWSYRNRYWMIAKNDTPASILMDLPFLAAYDLLRFVYLCLTNGRALSETARCLLKLLKMIRKRRPASVPVREIRRWMR